MADIKQAAKWMLEGKQVRRMNPFSSRENQFSVGVLGPKSNFREKGGVVVADAPHRVPVFSVEALLADDWEIAK